MSGDIILASYSVLIDDDEKLNRIVEHLSGGGTMTTYCKMTGESWASVSKWLSADVKRYKAYEMAKELRQDWLFERVLAEYTTMSTFDLTEVYNEDGALRPQSEWGDAARAMVSSVKSFEKFEFVDGEKVPVGMVMEVKLWDKTKTLEALGKYLKMFREQIDINMKGEISLVDAMKEANSRIIEADVTDLGGLEGVDKDEQKPI